ncbi:MAG: RNA-binding protein [Sphingobacteriales bacterium]|nr:RNA-binding protein [Sphingobacteriales bacterium]OJY89611.1 MAG: RNA-binding protein [Sphingobacteriales bacterium 44-15]
MNLYVGNLSWTMTEDDLRNLFEQYGTVNSLKIVKDRETGRSKGFGFVEMENDSEAQNALSSLYDKEILGRKIVINEAQERPAKSGGGGGGFKKRSFGGGGGGYNKGGGGGYRDRDRGGYNKRDYNSEY